MDPKLIDQFLSPILNNQADYTKGNRFFDLEKINNMPRTRLIGNAVLSLFAKISTGYWNLFDPTNGYTAIHANIVRNLPLKKISKGYFFETDILFRLNTIRAVVCDIPIMAHYGNEASNLRISKIIPEFARKHWYNFIKRIFYNYYLRDMSLASIELPIGLLLLMFGILFGGSHWITSIITGKPTLIGTVMLSALSILTGLQFVMAFIGYDISSVPKHPVHNYFKVKTQNDA